MTSNINDNSNKQTVDAVYFTNSQLSQTGSALPSEHDVCLAAADTVGIKEVRGAQRIRNLWRIYVNTSEARFKLLSSGIDLAYQHINLMHETPYAISNSNKTVKITLADVKIHVSNSYIESQLKAHGVRLTAPVKYSFIRDKNGSVTPFQNGERFTYAEYTSTTTHPLPRCILIGDSPI